jgi:hypothetical protein
MSSLLYFFSGVFSSVSGQRSSLTLPSNGGVSRHVVHADQDAIMLETSTTLPPKLEVIEGGLEAVERQLLEIMFGPNLENLPDVPESSRRRRSRRPSFRTPRKGDGLRLVGGTATTKLFSDR